MNVRNRRRELQDAVQVERRRNGQRQLILLIEEVLDLDRRVTAVEQELGATTKYIVDHEQRLSGLEASQRKYIRLFQSLLRHLNVEKAELVSEAVERAAREAIEEHERDAEGCALPPMPEAPDPATREALRRARGEVDGGCCDGGRQ